MNICHIFASKSWGGGEQYVFDLAQRQRMAGHSVFLVSGKSSIIAQKIKPTDYPCFILKNRWHFNPFSILKMRRIICSKKIEIIHTHQFKDAFIAVFASLLISKKNRPKVLMTRHLVHRGKNSFLYKFLYKKLDKLIFVSCLAKNEFLKTATLPTHKIVVIHNSIFPKTNDTHTDFRKLCGLKNDAFIVGFVGQIVAFKGVELLLEVAEKTDVAFLLAGRGRPEYETCLQQKIAEKKLQNRFFLLGFLDNTTDFIEQINVGILPSLCVEACPLAVLEFMQAGIPVITSNSGGQTEFVIQGETGLPVNPNVEEITAALTQLVNDNDFAKKIGKNAKLFAEKEMSYEVFFTQIMAVYDEK